ncbi:uncharacterized protein DEA37_0005507 [Paragonimus westermani]|uniref:Elapor1-like galactose binding domain-containing protein n=1 Tax=Paragonimus westermani TaxID=34504 RepID=A0A5J4NSJ2_9TREM|nr:uncharacterized protein DEA37_0005507 [Paragonimus westermani]
MENQECKNCPSGYFSKGNVLKITKWPELPAELSIDVSYNSPIRHSCNESSWYAKNDYLLGKATSDCTTLLSMKLHSLHDGLISFTYSIEEYGTVGFFTIRTERCSQLPGTTHMLAYTGYNVFSNMTVELPKGHHIVQWYLLADSGLLQALWSSSESTMKIGQIAVTGTPPILRCSPCPAGTWGATEGQAICDTCPENTFSNMGAQKCEVCSEAEYSRPGATRCSTRVPCTNLDYVPVWSSCDSNGMAYSTVQPAVWLTFFLLRVRAAYSIRHVPTDDNAQMQQSYKWIEPIICNTQLGVALPQAEKPIACRPCSLGTEPINHTHCVDCQADKPSLTATCLRCGVDRVPIHGILYDTWSRFPPHLSTWCTTFGAEKCQPWLLYANFISSGLGMSSQTAAILELSLPFGFVRSTEGSGDENDLIVLDPPIPDTHLRVEFEVVCSALCQLVLKQLFKPVPYTSEFQSQNGQRDVEIMSWFAGKTRQNYT